jgi:hypothetical protein
LRCGLENASYLVRYRSYFKELISEDLFPMLAAPEKINRKPDWLRDNYTRFETSAQGWGPSFRVYGRESYRREIVFSKRGQALLDQQARQGVNPKLQAVNSVSANGKPGGGAIQNSVDNGTPQPQFQVVPDFQPLADLCEREHIPLVLVSLPGYSFPELPKSKASQEIEQAQQQVLKAYLKQHPAVRYLDLSKDDDPIHYYDRGHQNAVGAVAFTDRLADILKQAPFRTLLSEENVEAVSPVILKKRPIYREVSVTAVKEAVR